MKFKPYFITFTILAYGLMLIACDQAIVATPEPVKEKQEVIPEKIAQVEHYNLTMTITVDGKQSHQEVIENVTLPPDQKSFCSSNLSQQALPEGSTVVSCTFNGTVGDITLAIRLLDMNLQMKTQYEYKKL